MAKILNLHCHERGKSPTCVTAPSGFLVLVLPHREKKNKKWLLVSTKEKKPAHNINRKSAGQCIVKMNAPQLLLGWGNLWIALFTIIADSNSWLCNKERRTTVQFDYRVSLFLMSLDAYDIINVKHCVLADVAGDYIYVYVYIYIYISYVTVITVYSWGQLATFDWSSLGHLVLWRHH